LDIAFRSAIQELPFLFFVLGTRESSKAGMAEPDDSCAADLELVNWRVDLTKHA